MTTGITMTGRDKGEIIRSLKILVPLIKEDLKNGDEAAERAGMPYYKAAGEKMIEAKPQVAGGFEPWVRRIFGISPRQARRYMALAHATLGKQIGRARPFESIKQFERETGIDTRPTGGAVRREWQPAVDDIADRARREMERVQQEEHLTRLQEREAETKLALRLIDIGYKVLAKELHPDKGGSREAMQRLAKVRDRLKASA